MLQEVIKRIVWSFDCF